MPLFTGTLLITAIAMVVAVPIGLMAAIYMSEYATQTVRTVAKPVLEVLAGNLLEDREDLVGAAGLTDQAGLDGSHHSGDLSQPIEDIELLQVPAVQLDPRRHFDDDIPRLSLTILIAGGIDRSAGRRIALELTRQGVSPQGLPGQVRSG